MSTINFMDAMRQMDADQRMVCVGMDTDYEKIPISVKEQIGGEWGSDNHIHDSMVFFNNKIIDATCDVVKVYKPNLAFYLPYGAIGSSILESIVAHAKSKGIRSILDMKVSEIENSAERYARFVFEVIGADAVTVNPYMGYTGLTPFLERKDNGIIVLCRTSNKGSDEFQGMICENGLPLYLNVAKRISDEKTWNKNKNCMLVTGATFTEDLKRIVEQTGGELDRLIPGIGAQGGDLEATLAAGLNINNGGIMINSSRGILYASAGEDFAEAARRETIKLQSSISGFISLRKQSIH
ncbi:MAG: orotidine-5'-phosphate decarboxylase [Candidatus Paceibacterota bacterium]